MGIGIENPDDVVFCSGIRPNQVIDLWIWTYILLSFQVSIYPPKWKRGSRCEGGTNNQSSGNIRILCNERCSDLCSGIKFIGNTQKNLKKRVILPKRRLKALLQLRIKTLERTENGDTAGLLRRGDQRDAIASGGGIADVDGQRADKPNCPHDGVQDESGGGKDNREDGGGCHGRR